MKISSIVKNHVNELIALAVFLVGSTLGMLGLIQRVPLIIGILGIVFLASGMFYFCISYTSEKRSEFDDTFIQSFASKMKIDESYVQEMKDTMESFLLIEKKPQWAESENLSDSEMAEINRQCKEDKDVLNDSIYDLVYLG